MMDDYKITVTRLTGEHPLVVAVSQLNGCATVEEAIRRFTDAHLNAPARSAPVNKELFERTAPKWNCVDFPNDGMHYVPHGDCLWCGMTRDQIRDERTKNAVATE